MKLKALGIIIASSIALSGCIINVNGKTSGPTHKEHKSLELNASDLSAFKAAVGAGELSIKGVRGQTDVRVEADINTYDDVSYTLTLEKSGNKAELVAEFDNNFSFNRSPYIDLVVTVPQQMMLDIHDGSGPIDIRGVDADININDGSGSIDLVGGQAVSIQDGSGSISISNAKQDIDIADGSGGIEIDGGQNIDINDGSGSISVSNTNGKLDIDDGSGSIDLDHIGGHTKINDGSGSITAHHINGKVTIDDGSGSIDVEYTKGLNIIDSGSGGLRFKHIDGPVSVDE